MLEFIILSEMSVRSLCFPYTVECESFRTLNVTGEG